MILLSGEDTRAVFDWPAAIAAMRAVYAQPIAAAANPGRVITASPLGSMRTMPAAPDGPYLGVKHLVKTSAGRVSYTILLFDQVSAQPAFLVDAHHITAMRTAATTAVAVAELVGEREPIDLAVIGSGLEARHHVEAFAAVRTLRSLAVYSPREQSRHAFAESFRPSVPRVRAAASARDAAAGATAVLAAARSYDEAPVLDGDDLGPTTLVLSIGSTLPSQRELDVSVLAHADAIVADDPHELTSQTGDMLAAAAAGIDVSGKTFSLADLVGGRLPGVAPSMGKGVTVYKSLGSGLQDVAMAQLLATRCVTAGRGRAVSVELDVKLVARS